MEKRFTALRTYGVLLKVLAWIALILGLLSAVLVLVLGFAVGTQLAAILQVDLGGELVGIVAFLLILIISALLFVLLYAGGEAVYAMLSIEENTRRTAYVLQQQYLAGQPAYSGPPAYAEDEGR